MPDVPTRYLPRQQFIAGFQCPDPTGQAAPCSGIRQVQSWPEIFSPEYGPMRCPVYRQVECTPYKRILEREAGWRREDWLRAGRAAGIPERFIDATFETARPAPAIDHVKAFLHGEVRKGRALVLLGPPGVGKTFALAAAVRAHAGARLIQCDGFVASCLDWDERGEAMAEAENASLLAFDDWGRAYLKPLGLAEASIEELLTYRHAELLPTILTSNWTPRELQRRLSRRLVDRLKEWAQIVTLPGASLRGA